MADPFLQNPFNVSTQAGIDGAALSVRRQLALALQAGLGSQECPLDVCANSYDFVGRYGVKIDGHDFDWNGYKHLIPTYQDDHPKSVFMAGAQTGKTARLIIGLVRAMIRAWGAMFGYYFPDYHLPKAFSSRRFAPMIRANPELGPWLGRDTARGKGEDRVLARTFGPSAVFFLSTAGKSSTEGLPLLGTFFDEVRRMEKGDIERAMERYSAQREPMDWKVSTARYPRTDIHGYFLEGDQRYFHTACNCPDGIVLSLTWPDCVMDLRRASPEIVNRVRHAFSHAGLPYLGMTDEEHHEYHPAAYYCPKCDTILTDPREGWWEPHNPRAYIHSWQMPQLLSPTYPAGRALYKWENNDDLQEVYNSMLGLTFLDPAKRPLTLDHLLACVNTQARWTRNMSDRWRRRHMVNTALGCDVQKGYNVVVVKKLTESGKPRVVHLEVPHGEDKWKRTAQLIEQYDVRYAVVDGAPEFDSAHALARAFPGRVFLATYGDSGEGTPIASWGDLKGDQGQEGDAQERHTVRIARTKALRWSLGLWEKRLQEIPDPDQLVVNLPVKGTDEDGAPLIAFTPFLRLGTWQPIRLALNGLFKHLLSVIFEDQKEGDDKAQRLGKRDIKAVHIGGIDPHFAHADLYCSVAVSRMPRRKIST